MGAFVWSKKYPGVGHRKNTRGQKVFYITYYEGGKRRMERVGSEAEGYTLALAHQIRAERIRADRHGDVLPAARRRRAAVTLGDVLERWLETSATKRSAHDDAQRVRDHVPAALAGRPAARVTPDDLHRLASDLREKGLAEATVRHVLVCVRTAWNRAAEARLVTGPNPAAQALKRMRPPQNRRLRYLTAEEYRALLEALEPYRVSLQLTVAGWNTGARFGELARLRWSDVDRDHGLLTFRDTKTGEPRRVPMNAELRDLFAGMEPGPGEALVWPTRTGRVLTDPPATWRRVVDRLFNGGVTDPRQRVSFHTLRHSFISHLVMRGVPLPVIQSLTGHKTLAMLQRYTHLAPDARWAAVEVLAGKTGSQNRPGLKD